jgi:hypothetical protein
MTNVAEKALLYKIKKITETDVSAVSLIYCLLRCKLHYSKPYVRPSYLKYAGFEGGISSTAF